MRMLPTPVSSGFLLLASVTLFQGCASKPDLRADYDKSVDFAKYRSFNFVKTPSTETLGYGNLVTQQMESSIKSELEKRGYSQADKPDLLVNFSGKLQEKADIQSTPSAGYYYGYRGYGAWPGYAYGTDVQTVRYTVGTINVDLIDAGRNQMVWEGVAVGEVTKKHLENREAAIAKAIEKIFSKYPFRAGVGEPVAGDATATAANVSIP
jgi:hypothetical protein